MKIVTTRRGFLGSAAVAGIAATVKPASAVVEPEPWGIKLGVATYTFRSFSRDKAIEMLKAVRAPWISIKDTDQQLSIKGTAEETAAARKQFDDAGFKV